MDSTTEYHYFEVDISQNEEIIGGFFLQCFQSNNKSPRAGIETLGSLNILRGKFVLGHKDDISSKTDVTIPFECSMAFASQLSIKRYNDEELKSNHDIQMLSSCTLPNDISPKEVIVIKGYQFPVHCPIEVMTTEIVLGNYLVYDEDLLRVYTTTHYRPKIKSVYISQTFITFKAYDTIKLPESHSKHFCLKEILFEKLTLNTFSVILPKHDSTPIIPSSPIGINLEAPRSPSRPVAVTAYERFHHRLYRYVLLPYVPELLLVFTSLLSWLVYQSYFITLTNVHVHLFYSSVFFCISVLLVASGKYLIQNYCTSTRTNGLSFYVNGWQAWSFAGSVLQGSAPPLYAMPHLFVENFHHAGQGTALPINQGYGTIPYAHLSDTSLPQTNPSSKQAKNRYLMSSQKYQFYLPIHRDYVASDMFTYLCDLESCAGLVVGFLSQRQQYGCIGCNMAYDQLSIHVSGDGVLLSSKGAKLTSDPYLIYFTEDAVDPFQIYMNLSSQFNNVSRLFGIKEEELDDSFPASTAKDNLFHPHTIPAGWCSWYHFYEKINENVILENINTMKDLQEQYYLSDRGFQLFQIDDGYQLHWGDWTEIKKEFNASRTLQHIVDAIHIDNMIGGLWLAPFACDQNSNVAAQHPDWILCQDKHHKKPCNSANCGKFFYGLDVTNPAVQRYIGEFLRVVTTVWGFRYLKLDFLYAAVLNKGQISYFDRSLTKAQIMTMAMRIVENEVSKKKPYYILGCGAPLGSVVGFVHANRISADAGLTWKPSFPLPSTDRWNLPCARNMVRNTLNRLYMHNKWWVNDPDCVVIRDALPFSLAELIGIATAKFLSGGSVILSDDLKAVSRERMRLFLRLFPPTNQAATAVDMMGKEIPELFRLKLYKEKFKSVNIYQSRSKVFAEPMTNINSPFSRPIPPPPSLGDECSEDLLLLKQFSQSGGLFNVDVHESLPIHIFGTPPQIKRRESLRPECHSTEDRASNREDDDSPILFSLLPSNIEDKGMIPGAPSSSPPQRTILSSRSLSFHHPNPHPPSLSLLQASFSPLREVSEDHVLDSAFPSPTVYTRKFGSIDRRGSATSDSGDSPPNGKNEGGIDLERERQHALPPPLDLGVERGIAFKEKEEGGISPPLPHPPVKPRESSSLYLSLDELVPITILDDPLHADGDKGGNDLQSHTSSQHSMGRQSSGTIGAISHLAYSSDEPLSPRVALGTGGSAFSMFQEESGGRRETSPLSPELFLFKEQLKNSYFDAQDLHKVWYLFAACNWAEEQGGQGQSSGGKVSGGEGVKGHFVPLVDVFGEEELQYMRDYMDILYNRKKFYRKFNFPPKGDGLWHPPSSHSIFSLPSLPSIHQTESILAKPFATSISTHPPSTPLPSYNNFDSLPAPSSNLKGGRISRIYRNTQYKTIIHMYNFWTASYSYKKVSLIPSLSSSPSSPCSSPHPSSAPYHEIPFLDIPVHSASLYHISLSLHPMKPLYLGSSLHLSCGYEVFNMKVLTKIPSLHKRALFSYVTTALPRKRSRSNIFVSKQYKDFVPQICTLCVQFEDEMMGGTRGKTGEESEEGEQIHLFLPVNINKARQFNHLLGKVEISGSACRSGEGVSVGGIELVCYVEEEDCHTAGYIYKIPVRKAKEGAENVLSPSVEKGEDDCPQLSPHRPFFPQKVSRSSSDGAGQGGGATEGAEGGAMKRDYLIISWIYDIKDSAPKNS